MNHSGKFIEKESRCQASLRWVFGEETISPANIVHMLICNKVVKILQDCDEYETFINILDADERNPYLNL